MKLVLTNDDVLKVLHTSFCDGGLIELRGSSIEMDCLDADYQRAKSSLRDAGKTNICLEDVWVEMININLPLRFIDYEDDKKEYFLTLKSAKKGFQNRKAAMDVIKTLDPDGDTDAYTGYNLLQYALFNDVIYG